MDTLVDVDARAGRNELPLPAGKRWTCVRRFSGRNVLDAAAP